MLISLITGWLAVFFTVMTAVKFLARKSGNQTLNRFFRRIHIPFGEILLVVGLIHGLLAGNPWGTSLSDADFGSVLLTANAGTVCYLFAVLLGITYLLRRVLRKKWMIAHRVLTVLMILTLGVHLYEMGITLPEHLFPGEQGPEILETVETTEKPTEAATQPTAVETTVATAPTETEPVETEPVVEFSGAVLADGVYTGSAQGYKGTIAVEVTVQDGQVVDISIASQSETRKYWARAVEIVETILGEQSLAVDTVSGATHSSAAILEAVQDALAAAVIEGQLQITQIKGSH